MSKRKREAERELREAEEKITLAKKDLQAVMTQGNGREEKMKEAEPIINRICVLKKRKHYFQDILHSEDNGVYGKARVIISNNGSPGKEITVIMKGFSIQKSFETDKYIVSKDCLLAQTIRETPVNCIGIYGEEGRETSVRVIEKDFK